MPWIKKPGEPIPTTTVVAAVNFYNEYAQTQVQFVPPVVTISFEHEEQDTRVVDVHMDVTYNDTNFHLRSIKAEDHETVHTYLNSQDLVRRKYANKKTVSAEATKGRVETLAKRFDPAVTDGCFMHGGFYLSDNDTDEFLGMVNSGHTGKQMLDPVTNQEKPEPYSEIGVLLGAYAWSHKPENIVEEYPVPKPLKKEYSGVGTVGIWSLAQYTRKLKEKNYTIKGQPIEEMRACGMIDNEGGWKAACKSGMKVWDISAREDYGDELRYELRLKL